MSCCNDLYKGYENNTIQYGLFWAQLTVLWDVQTQTLIQKSTTLPWPLSNTILEQLSRLFTDVLEEAP